MSRRSITGLAIRPVVVTAGLIAAALLPGCASERGGNVPLTEVTGLDGPLIRHREPIGDGGEDQAIAGIITLEGQCVYIGPEVGEGERFPIVWPAGTRWDPESSTVVLASGDRVVSGDSISGGGGHHDVESVRATSGDEAADIVESCLDNTYGEVLVMNNFPDAVRKNG